VSHDNDGDQKVENASQLASLTVRNSENVNIFFFFSSWFYFFWIVQYAKKVDLYARYLIEKSGFWSSLVSSCIAPACVHATLSHSPHAHPPSKSRICHGGLRISNHFKLGNEVTPTPTSRGVQIVV